MSGTNGTNGANGHDHPKPLPSAKPFQTSSSVTIHPPLTRRGNGPGLILLVPLGLDLNSSDKTLDPPPLQKWAEEGWAVAQITLADGEDSKFHANLKHALAALDRLDECESTENTGLILYNIPASAEISRAVDATKSVSAVISYSSDSLHCSKSQLHHIPKGERKAQAELDNPSLTTFNYPDAGPFFTIPSHDDFRSASAALSHTRCLSFLKPLTGGPWFDLEAIWDEHCKFEFGERAVEKTMGTMVQEPYVNHIPTITGGIGRTPLTNFYRDHFVFNNPEDTALELISRTVGIDRVIDEFVFSFTHDKMIDWLAPGVPPTGQHCEIPFVGVINVRGDRLYHEHIHWDQATALKQMGLIPDYLPFPYKIDGKEPGPGKLFEYKVPTAGKDVTKKLVDERSVESNGMFDFAIREVDK